MRRADDLFQKVILQNTPSHETVRNQLKFFALRIFDTVIENNAVACFAITATFSPSHHSSVPDFIITQYDTTAIEIIQNLVKQGIDRKEFQSINVKLVAWLYASYITKAVLEQVSLSPQRIRREELISILDGFLDSLQPNTVNAQ